MTGSRWKQLKPAWKNLLCTCGAWIDRTRIVEHSWTPGHRAMKGTVRDIAKHAPELGGLKNTRCPDCDLWFDPRHIERHEKTPFHKAMPARRSAA